MGSTQGPTLYERKDKGGQHYELIIFHFTIKEFSIFSVKKRTIT